MPSPRPGAPASPIKDCLADLHARYKGVTDGAVASYIPELSKADPNHFGIAVVTADGQSYAIGDCDVPFTIQSISKAFVFGLALEDHGRDHVLRKVGVEPSGDAFNSIIFDVKGNRPFNPMVNAGAIATAALVKGAGIEERLGRVMAFMERFTGRPLAIDETVYLSEKATGHRNRAIAHLELNFGMIDDRVEEHLDLYFQQCSILVTARDLGVMAATLANNGVNPVTGVRALDERYVKNVIAVMSTCGMYDYAGEWLYRVGLPAKSGVGGGIVSVLPGQLGIGTFSPPLDERGNSVRGIKVCEELSERFGLYMFDAPNAVNSAVARHYRGDRVGSKRVRGPWEQAVLAEAGRAIRVYELRGDLFFSSVEQLVRRVVEEEEQGAFLLLDAKRVGHIDAPAAGLVADLAASLKAADVTMRVANLLPGSPVRERLEAAGFGPDAFLDNLDAALEWAEQAILDARPDHPDDAREVPLADMEILAGLPEEALGIVAAMTEEVAFPAGSVVFRQGDPADRLYFLARGQASIHVSLADGRSWRLATISPGVGFGEMALLDGKPRSAEIRADTDLVCRTLALKRLDQLKADHPEVLTGILANLARILSARLRKANDEIRALEA